MATLCTTSDNLDILQRYIQDENVGLVFKSNHLQQESHMGGLLILISMVTGTVAFLSLHSTATAFLVANPQPSSRCVGCVIRTVCRRWVITSSPHARNAAGKSRRCGE